MTSKKPMGLMIAVASRKPPDLDEPGGGISKRNNAQEMPEDEREFHDRGGAPKPTPESVVYRTAEQSCGRCEYFGGGNCAFLNQPVNDGDSCKRFEDKREDEQEPEHDAGGMSHEYEEEAG
jgi:hypothetical protein